jgi:hypothetical protein
MAPMIVQFGSGIVCVEIAGYFSICWMAGHHLPLMISYFFPEYPIVCVFLGKAYKEFMPHDEYCLLLCGSKMSLKVSSLPRISYIYVSILLYNYLFPVFS